LKKIRILAAIILLVSAMFAALPLRAQAVEQDTNLVATLAYEGPVRAGETTMVAIHFSPVSDEWHGYWSNPGDAGLGMQLEWNLPAGWSAGEPQYPVPQQLRIIGLMNHIYKGEYAVLIPIEVATDFAASGTVPISLKARWLACTDAVCIPENGTLSAFLPTDPAAKGDPRFGAWRAAVAPPLDSLATFERDGGSLRLAIPMPASMSLDAPHLYVENERLVDYGATQIFRRLDDRLIVEIPLKGEAHPELVEGILALGGGNGVLITAEPGTVPEGGELIAGEPDSMPSIWILLLGAFAGGLILNIMPCVFPILSIKALSLARAGESEARARSEGVAYTAGVVLACVALGGVMLALRAAGEQVGWAFQLQEPGVVVFLLFLAAAITANFAGLFELPSISFTRSGEPASAFATGLLAAFAATPCTGPFMAAALGAALLLPPVQALVLFAALGLGLALPFLLIGFVPTLRRMLPTPGAWMEKFRKAMAIPMGLTALALIWLVRQLGGDGFVLIALIALIGLIIALAIYGRRQREGKTGALAFSLIAAPFLAFAVIALPAAYDANASSKSQSILAPQTFSEESLAAARESGQPVFLWFTADWCLTCKVNEQVAIEREATKEAFEAAGVIPMVGDWTRRDAEISTFLTNNGAAGVPFYLWYEPGEEGEVMPQVLTSDMLIEKAQAARPGTR
jgi:DsbC/DsbD-like thiol-disulfide interchange protein/cytochrome c biogenesis protein CcdA